MEKAATIRSTRRAWQSDGYSLASSPQESRTKQYEYAGKEILPAPSATSSMTALKASGEELFSTVKAARTASQKVERSQPLDFDAMLTIAETCVTSIASYVAAINGLPGPGSGRDPEISKALLPMAIYSWAKTPPADEAVLLQQLYLRAHPSSGAALKIEAPEWLRTTLQYLSLNQTGKKFPDHSTYVAQSKKLASAYADIQAELAELDERIEKLEQINAANEGRGKPPPYVEQVATAKGNRRAVEEKIKPLFDRMDDVLPEQVPAALDALGIKASASPIVLQALLKVTLAIERVALLAIRAAAGKRIEPTELRIPLLTGSGKVELHDHPLTPEDLKGVGSDPRKLGSLLRVFETYRATLRSFYQSLPHCTELAADGPAKLREFLRQPFVRFGAPGQAAIRGLLERGAPECRLGAAKLLEAPVVLDAQEDRWAFVLDRPENFDLLSTVISRFLSATDELEALRLKELLKVSPGANDSALGPAEHTRKLRVKGGTGPLALFLDEQIRERVKQPDRLKALGLIAIIDHFASDPAHSLALRHQIPALDKIKEIAATASKGNEHLCKVLPEVIHGIVRALSQSLRDYYMEDPSGALEELVENYRYFLSHPDCLKGVSGNEGIRTAVAIYGPPGVGKTYLVNCLKNELNVELFVLSPSEKKDGQDRLDYTREVIRKVKDHKAPCILLIDEAETTAVDRMSPAATSEDRDRTNYLLQEVDELRRSHPRVFIVIASNYPDRVDDAMIRPGRVDLEYHMQPPGAQSRESIILNTLKKEQISLSLSSEQIEELVRISEGFIPVQIIQTVVETHRLYVPRRREKDEDFELSFELLKQRFEGEAARLRKHQERLRRKGSSFLKDVKGSE